MVNNKLKGCHKTPKTNNTTKKLKTTKSTSIPNKRKKRGGSYKRWAWTADLNDCRVMALTMTSGR